MRRLDWFLAALIGGFLAVALITQARGLMPAGDVFVGADRGSVTVVSLRFDPPTSSECPTTPVQRRG